jgi:putative membrane-bound dehydrogenase-like protein
MRLRPLLAAIVCLTFALGGDRPSAAQTKKDVIPHGQSQLPGPPLTPDEAIKKMQVPPGFRVELVAAEPKLVNPVAMTFDEKGRIWITESIEYPRHSAGTGKDRVKLLESTKGDGNYDKVQTVIEGLNIPSGIAVGHGGVWVVNSPDILFYPFLDRDAPKLGKPEVVVTGFGRSDTHELPNSLTWGPDGYLYGLNGVFNPSVVKQDGKEWRFTCAMFRIHPKTKKFDIFCEGTSNPWGIAFNDNGDAFVSACVIDHLWHLTQTGYYHRQGGPYPPYTWKIESIVKHRHQKAAYCGLCWFDSDAYPPEYREKLYMGNIHGNCINSDELTRDGSTYLAKPRPDFLTANDAWFMPVSQQVGPDGCLYILDWYDRYHCYQDAGRDPAGIDRLRGRLYRVVYKEHKTAARLDLGAETSAELVQRMTGPNGWVRAQAQRLLSERLAVFEDRRPNAEEIAEVKRVLYQLKEVITKDSIPQKARLHAMWVLLNNAISSYQYLDCLKMTDPIMRAWGVRAASNQKKVAKATEQFVAALARDSSPDVRLQVAIAACKLKEVDQIAVLFDVLTHAGDDKLIPHIVWQNLHPLLEKEGDRFLALAAKSDIASVPGLAKVLPRAVDCILGNAAGDPTPVSRFVEKLISKDPADPTARLALKGLAAKVRNGELAGKQLDALKKELLPTVHGMISSTGRLHLEAASLGAALKDDVSIKALRREWGATEQPEDRMLTALDALTAAGDSWVLDSVGAGLADPKTGSPDARARMLSALAKLDDVRVAAVVLGSYPTMEPELQPRAIDLLTERASWSKRLLGEIAAKKIAPSVLNVNQVRKLLASKDKDLVKQVTAVWGTLRTDRNPQREQVVAQMRDIVKKTPGDAHRGVAVFKKVCAQCHKIYGEGVDVGPDITANGRSDFEQLLSNVFDPSLVIGAGYQATTVVTTAGQVLTGLVVEDSLQRVVLKVQGGELKTIPRSTIDEINVSKVSLMPEGLENQLQRQEIADLFAYLTLDRPPDDPKARRIPGTPR